MALQWKVISQRNWLKGLQATFARFAQPQGVIVRLANLLYDIRGGLRTTDGSLIFTELLGATDHEGPILDIILYSPAGQQPYYVGMMKGAKPGDQIQTPVANTPTFSQVGGTILNITYAGLPAHSATCTLTAPHGLTPSSTPNGQVIIGGNSVPGFNQTVTFSAIAIVSPTAFTFPFTGTSVPLTGTGGTVSTGLESAITAGTTFTYEVTASDGQGGETPITSPVSASSGSPNNAVTITWTAVPGAVGYNVYGRIAGSIGQLNGNGNLYANLVTGTTFTDLGGAPNSTIPPTVNTTQTVIVYLMAAPLFQQVLGIFPSYIAPPLGNIPGATNRPLSIQAGATPQGGIVGSLQPLPQIVQFTNKLIFAMGNGYPPQEYLDIASGGNGNLVPVGNSFNAQFPDWQASVAWNQGDTIKDSVSGGLFKAQQAGTSGATRPVFVNTLNATTAENTPGTIVWRCVATSATGTPLRGAAHAIVYAGSLWIANTWPTTTADQLDGPNCLKMSDVNNVESWNPANVAFLAKDDGDQITSLATYTIAQTGIAPTGSLVIFKNFSTFQATGVFGAVDFTLQQAQTDMGNVAGRTAQFIPGYGIARLAHLGFAYFNGVSDKLISEEIRPYLFGGPKDIAPIDWNFAYLSKGAQAANPPMYVAACPVLQPVLTGVTVAPGSGSSAVFVRVEKIVNGAPVAVTAEVQAAYATTPAVTITTPAAVPGVTYRVFVGGVPGGENLFAEAPSYSSTTINLSDMTTGFMAFGNGGLTRIFAYDLVQKQWAVVDIPFQISCLKQIRTPGTIPLTIAGGANDGAVRRFFAGDQTWDDGSQVLWSFRAGEIFQEGATAKMFYRRLVLRGSNNLEATLTVTVNLQGTDNVMSNGVGRQVLGEDYQWEMRVDIMRDAENANAQISGAGPVQIQIDSMDWHVKPKPSGTPVTIQK